jgi:hypothetical protein
MLKLTVQSVYLICFLFVLSFLNVERQVKFQVHVDVKPRRSLSVSNRCTRYFLVSAVNVGMRIHVSVIRFLKKKRKVAVCRCDVFTKSYMYVHATQASIGFFFFLVQLYFNTAELLHLIIRHRMDQVVTYAFFKAGRPHLLTHKSVFFL